VEAGVISGVTIALVEDQQIIFVRGFGWADKKRGIPSAPDTVYRAGSISKLFTAVSAMQLVEQGRVDIDKPVTTYLPELQVIVPFEEAGPITLRQLMCHRSGMVREAPVGGYFDGSAPGMERTVASLGRCVLLYRPGTRTRYSNSGVTIVGRAVEQMAGVSFPDYQQQHVLTPLGMTNSEWLRTSATRRKLATGYLPVAQVKGGFREVDAPVFEFGILAAGNLYTTAEDLGRFLNCLFAEGRTGGTHLLRPDTLAQMFTPQLTSDTNAFGLGFSLGTFRGRRSVSHMGAVYGFTSSLMALPSEKVGVVVLCNDDIVTGPVRKLNALALGLMLAHKTGQAPPVPAPSLAFNVEELKPFSGDFESQSFWARVEVNRRELVANISGQKLALTAVGTNRFVGEGRIAFDTPFNFHRDSNGVVTGFTALNQSFRRVDTSRIPAVPAAWKTLQGSYGPEFIPLIVSVRHGHLYAMTENEFDNRLTPVTETVFQMPPGLYVDEYLIFQTDRKGKAHTAVLGNMPLRRR
jgi:CubicO group peptidase (beta-lactamase class C family)